MKKNLKSQIVISNLKLQNATSNLQCQNGTSSCKRSRCQNVTMNKGEVVTNCDHLEEEFSRSQIATLNNKMEVANCDLQNGKILLIRGQYVIIDRDIAEIYGVPTKRLNEAVKRNGDRFPEGFMFQLTSEELSNWRSQFATSNSAKMAVRYRPYAFTEHGVIMLAAVLNSTKAVEMSLKVVQSFVAMRKFMMASAGVLQRLGAIEIKQLETDKKFATVFDALDRGNLLPQGILETGAEFDAFRFVTRLVESAKKEIVLIDPYSDALTLEVLAKKAKGVKVRLICRAMNWLKPTATEIAKFNRQYKGLTVERSDNFHDRFVIIDGAELYNLGSSINSLGRRLTTYTTRDPKEIAKVLTNV